MYGGAGGGMIGRSPPSCRRVETRRYFMQPSSLPSRNSWDSLVDSFGYLGILDMLCSRDDGLDQRGLGRRTRVIQSTLEGVEDQHKKMVSKGANYMSTNCHAVCCILSCLYSCGALTASCPLAYTPGWWLADVFGLSRGKAIPYYHATSRSLIPHDQDAGNAITRPCSLRMAHLFTDTKRSVP